MFKYIYLLFFILISQFSFAQTPKYVNEFLSIGVGARPMAMGSSVIASISDGTASYWNPAGLASNYNARQFNLMHSNYFSGLAVYDYGNLALRLNHENALGFTFIRFGVDNIPNTLNLIDNTGNIQYDKIRSFSAADYAGIFSYGRQTKNESFKFGMSIKVIRRVAGKFADAWGFGADIGIQKHVKSWHFGLMIRDVTTTFNVWQVHEEELRKGFTLADNEIFLSPTEITLPRLIVGIAKEQQIKGLLSFLIELNADITTDGARNTLIKADKYAIDPHGGIELNYASKFFFRFGVNNIQYELDDNNKLQSVYQPSLGAGVKLKNITLDYAITDIGDRSETNYSNVISLKFDFNKIR